MARKKSKEAMVSAPQADYGGLLSRISFLLEQGRRSTMRTTNAILTTTYWEVGRQIVEFEQGGQARAEYCGKLLENLARDLTARFGRGFSRRNVEQMRAFYLGWHIVATVSSQLQARVKCSFLADSSAGEKPQTVSAELQPLVTTQLPLDPTISLLNTFPLSWSHYVRLMSVRDDFARWFYEDEVIRGGWSVRQLDRQVGTQFDSERPCPATKRPCSPRTGHPNRKTRSLPRIRTPGWHSGEWQPTTGGRPSMAASSHRFHQSVARLLLK